jgi:multidrug efflux system membrane fusion protein
VHAADDTGLVVITQLQPISIIFTVAQNDLPRLLNHTDANPFPVTIFSSDGAVELDHGTLELVDNTVDATTGTVRLKAKSANEAQRLWPGEFVKVRMQTGLVPQGVVIAQEAVTRGPKGPFAYVVTPEKTVEMRPLELGGSYNNETVVARGVKPGETVVLEGQIKLAPGMKVKIAETRGATPGHDVAQSAGTIEPDAAAAR